MAWALRPAVSTALPSPAGRIHDPSGALAFPSRRSSLTGAVTGVVQHRPDADASRRGHELLLAWRAGSTGSRPRAIRSCDEFLEACERYHA
jgi:hypothetical protein